MLLGLIIYYGIYFLASFGSGYKAKKPFNANISIMIASKNEKILLERTLNSIVTCNYPKENIQIIIITSGSTDDTTEFCQNFAKEHNILMSKERVRVYISFNPDSSTSKREKVLENYNIVVEKKAGNLSRALVPINRLIPLSKESVIWSIKLPDRLIKPRK